MSISLAKEHSFIIGAISLLFYTFNFSKKVNPYFVIVPGKLQVTRLYFLKEIVLANFQRLFRRSDRDVFLENEGKIHEGGCVKELFSSTCRLASRNFITDYLFTDNF